MQSEEQRPEPSPHQGLLRFSVFVVQLAEATKGWNQWTSISIHHRGSTFHLFVEGFHIPGGDIATMVNQTLTSVKKDGWTFATTVTLLSVIFAGMQETTAFPSWRLEV